MDNFFAKKQLIEKVCITRVVILIICLLALSLSLHENRFALQVKSSFLKLFLTQKNLQNSWLESHLLWWKASFCPQNIRLDLKASQLLTMFFSVYKKTVDISPIWIFDLWFRNSVGVLLRGRYCIKWKKIFPFEATIAPKTEISNQLFICPHICACIHLWNQFSHWKKSPTTESELCVIISTK